jgi:hypothetical protein
MATKNPTAAALVLAATYVIRTAAPVLAAGALVAAAVMFGGAQ